MWAATANRSSIGHGRRPLMAGAKFLSQLSSRFSVKTNCAEWVGDFLMSATTSAREEYDNNLSTGSSIVFATLGRAQYKFDIFTQTTNHHQNDELQLTDGESVNYNGFFPSSTSFLFNQTLSIEIDSSSSLPPLQVVYVTERNGTCNIYLDGVYYGGDKDTEFGGRRRSVLEIGTRRVQIPLLQSRYINGQISMKDRPSISEDYLVYVSTHENPELPRKSWAAVYSTHLITGETRRLTPNGIADFSPSISPSGIWTAVASSGEKGWDGEIEGLDTGIYVFKTKDGSDRVKVVEHGGWPCWFDEFTIYFHRESDDGWWSIYRAILPQQNVSHAELVIVERVTPPGLHVFTPATSSESKGLIAVATRRSSSTFRHIELFDLTQNEFIELTRPISPEKHHYNPFLSPDGSRVGYHRCQGNVNGAKDNSPLLLENIKNPDTEVSLFRIDGSFPSFSPDGKRIVYVGLPGLYVVNSDGSGKRRILPDNAFSTAWDWKRKGVVYTSVGPVFATEKTQVDIISVNVDEEESGELGLTYAYNKLTTDGQNNAFPSASPDGKWIVFRSGRSGHKNLYIMDAIEGERGGLHQLTKGPWTDTMCNWSPDGEWIAFASDRDNPGGGSFAIYFIHPNGTGLRKVIHSGEGGRTNHPWFSPDSKSLVFTSDFAAVSAEPIANPHHFQPYGDIFIANADGSGIQRLTHNSYEDGTPAWGPIFMKPVDVTELPFSGSTCAFDDCHWLNKAPTYKFLASPKPRCS
ncbi:Dpp6 n-terminal domain-like protein [Thalictrum thalictroides]|uniref:Dpp6 n-terminal domain-like protein n=1 Tax=Thalictrum thalictroides TaxID=46969 RepID=A0A7J6WT34_THATH|nr:Dpp6 n-terminal domain-like protein [Thalictrum thalictroides]